MTLPLSGSDGMAPELCITLGAAEFDGLHEFMRTCNNKREYRKSVALVMRADGWSVADVAERLSVTEKTVCGRTAAYCAHGIGGLKRRKREKWAAPDWIFTLEAWRL